MKSSGTKLVVGLACLALAAGVASWSYRYGATHRATGFWGSGAAPLIAQPSQVELLCLELVGSRNLPSEVSQLRLDLGRPYRASPTRELTSERGMVHLRHALMSDGNYLWNDRPEPQQIEWRWCLRFHNEDHQTFVVLAEDFATIGQVVADDFKQAGDSKQGGDSRQVRAVSCHPMAETLRQYFHDLGLDFHDLGLGGS